VLRRDTKLSLKSEVIKKKDERKNLKFSKYSKNINFQPSEARSYTSADTHLLSSNSQQVNEDAQYITVMEN